VRKNEVGGSRATVRAIDPGRAIGGADEVLTWSIVQGETRVSHGEVKVWRVFCLEIVLSEGVSIVRSDSGSDLLDAVNRRLLAELHGDPRMTMSALARRVGMSAPAVTERVQRMERAGIIRGYRLDIDPAALGYPVTAWVRVRPVPGQLPKIAALVTTLANVTECYRISGDDCFLVKVHSPTIEGLEQTLDKILVYGQTITSIVHSSPVPPRPLPVAVE
jgi:Lrp/AsnC family transcriptional regulator, leucine-responsive regulatory protein